MSKNKARDMLLALWLYSNKDWDKTYKNLKDKIYPDVDKVLEGVDREAWTTLLDDDYPEEYKARLWPPFAIERKAKK